MKRQRHRFKVIALLLFLCFLVLGAYGLWSVHTYGSRWFSHASNPRLTARKQTIIEGDILDRNETPLATTVDGERIFQDSAQARAAMVHVIGDRNGQIGNSVESFQAPYLYGVQSSLLDALNHLIKKTERRGNTVVLTVSAPLTSEAYRSFSTHALSAGKSGAVVVMNWKTGEVLALLSFPSFDPDQVTEEEISQLDHPYVNRVTQAAYPPGSTFKVVTAAALLSRDESAAERTFYCEGTLQVTDTFTVRDFNSAVHGKVTLAEAFRHSCNNVFAALALELGDPALKSQAEKFGFNENFLFRDLIVYNSAYPSAGQTRDALAASGYGQSGITATPLHMCLIASAVANGGVMPEPRLLKTVRSSAGTTVLPFSSASVRTVCSSRIAETLRTMMRSVVQNGSGSPASVSTLDVCGKTGTAVSTLDGQPINYGWFIGFNAQEDLPFALCILVEDIPDGETGGTSAAPIAGDLFKWLRNHPDEVR